jgi:hypothetical protein
VRYFVAVAEYGYPRPAEPGDAARIAAAAWAEDVEWGLLVWLLLVTGARRGELPARGHSGAYRLLSRHDAAAKHCPWPGSPVVGDAEPAVAPHDQNLLARRMLWNS